MTIDDERSSESELSSETDEEDYRQESEPLRSVDPIVYFGTDFDVHGLVRRLKQNDIKVPSFDPAVHGDGKLSGFQRKFVWKTAQMERFVESLLLGFPVPGIFLVQQRDKSLLVLDGQQRLSTLRKFYDDGFVLDNVVDDLRGFTYSKLDDEQRRSIDNVFIHATVIKYEDSARGAESIYSIFERLNAGGTNLHPHEIRVALHNGKLVSLVRDLNETPSWRTLYGPINARLKDQELILRFVSFYFWSDKYERPLKSFLNKFLYEHRNIEPLVESDVSRVFVDVCDVINAHIGRKAFRITGSINSALVDAVMVGVARRLRRGKLEEPSRLRTAFDALVADGAFKDAIGRATADEERVRTRLDMATRAFEGV
jgi:hypothetical protein